MHTINTYTLQQQNDEIIDYVSDEIDGKRVVMQALKFEFENKTIYTLDGLIMQDGDIIHDFAPSSKTQYKTQEEAREALENIVASYEPVEVLQDEASYL